MSKRPDESYLEYRKRVLDPKSASFCAAKWLNATIWLGSGTTASCHHPPAHRIDPELVKENPKAIHNTMHKKLMRAQMLRGERPSECDYCWKIEDIKRDNVSDRVFKSVIYDEAKLDEIASLDAEKDVELETLEIAFDRTCNFACSYCNASFSTTWAKDIKKLGPYQNLVSDGARAFQQDGAWAQKYKNDENNPFVNAFWKWLPELSKTLKELRITGGEPLLSPHVWRLFEFIKESEYPSLRLAVNSNLGVSDDLIERLIDYSKSISQFDLYTSCEAYGAQAEYIRDGLNFEKFCENFEKLAMRGEFRQLHMMMTINSLALFSITDFLDKILEWKAKFGAGKPSFSVNILRFPSFMSPLALPVEIKRSRYEHLQEWLKKNAGSLQDFEIEGLQRLIDYIDVVKTPHPRTSSLDSQWRDFRSFYAQYDVRRNKNLMTTFPTELTDWVSSLPCTDLSEYQKLVDGDASAVWRDSSELKRLAKKQGWVLNPEDKNPQ